MDAIVTSVLEVVVVNVKDVRKRLTNVTFTKQRLTKAYCVQGSQRTITKAAPATGFYSPMMV